MNCPPEITPGNVEAVLKEAGHHPADWPGGSRSDFDEGRLSKKNHPLANLIHDPTWEYVARLDGDHDDSPTQADPAEVIRMLFDFFMDVGADDARGLSPIATRILAAVWVVNPTRLNNAPGCEVARKWGISHTKFSTHAAEFSRKFGVRNGWQANDAKNKIQPRSRHDAQ
jgi:hypothetical protein